GSLALLAGLVGRQFSAPVALGVAAAAMTGLEPQLLWDVSFQLSFLAMAGLLVFPSGFKNPVISLLAATLGATLATLGVVALNFHRLPLVAVPATLMALPALPGIMATSALTALGGLASPPLGQALGWLAWPWLSYLIWVVEGWSQLPAWELEAVNEAAVWAYYGALGLGLFLAQGSRAGSDGGWLAGLAGWLPVPTPPRFRAVFWLLAPLIIIGGAWGATLLGQPTGRLRIAFLDVGQGDAILIQTPSGVKVLIDGGPNPQLLAQRLGEQLPFGERDIDLVIISHPQADHLAGLLGVVPRYSVGQVVEAAMAASPLYQEWQNLLAQGQIPQLRVQAGAVIDLGDGLRARVLHPQALLPTPAEGEVNEASVVLRL
ncbi:MAG: ComEC/Rec2 family competence protein, partial [Chloroflexota bacterium]